MIPKIIKNNMFYVLFLVSVLVGSAMIYAVNMSEQYQFEENKIYIELVSNKGFSIDKGSVQSPSIIYTVNKDEFLEILNTKDLADEIVFSSYGSYNNFLYAFSPDYQKAWSVQIGYWEGDLEA